MSKKIYILIVIAGVFLITGGFFILQKSKTVSIENIVVNDGGSDVAPEDMETVVENVEPEAENTPEPESENLVENNEKKIEPENKPVVVEKASEESESSKFFGIKNKLVSFGYQKASGRKIDTIIIHSSYNSLGGDEYSVDKILDIYKSYGVAAHYIIDRKGSIYRLVEEKNIAYHAGESKVPDGRTGVNAFSVGIEMVNTKTDKYTAAQYNALKNLVADIKTRYKIKYTLGHNQIAPGRKDDPWNFDWDKLK